MTVCICASPLRLLSHAHQTGITIQGVQKLLEVELKWLRKVRVCVNDSSYSCTLIVDIVLLGSMYVTCFIPPAHRYDCMHATYSGPLLI